MKIPKIVKAMDHIDESLVADAASESKKIKNTTKIWLKWGGIAACLAVLVIAGTVFLPMLFKDEPNNVMGDLDDGRYKDFSLQSGELARVWQWEYKTVYEKYVNIDVDGKKFTARGKSLSEKYVDAMIGTFVATGYDDIEGGSYNESFEVYKIKDVSKDKLVAVKMEGKYYVFIADPMKAVTPPTLGELMEAYAIDKYVELGRFSVGTDSKKYYELTKDDEYIWSVLTDCSSAKAVADQKLLEGWYQTTEKGASFTVTSEALGIYKNVMTVTSDGYLWTNAFDAGFLYHIGEESAQKIIKYAKNNSQKADFEPFYYSIVGKITKVTDEYILVDDSILCKDPSDGIIFKISLDDMRVKRYVLTDSLKVGMTVQVMLEGKPSKNQTTVSCAFAIYDVIIHNDHVLIPE